MKEFSSKLRPAERFIKLRVSQKGMVREMKKAVIFGRLEVCRQAYTKEELCGLQEVVDLYPVMIDQKQYELHASAMADAEIIFTASGICGMKTC